VILQALIPKSDGLFMGDSSSSGISAEMPNDEKELQVSIRNSSNYSEES